jgi:outer membrane protein assembly factor BamB
MTGSPGSILSHPKTGLLTLLIVLTSFSSLVSHANPVTGWLNWRGPHQNGTSDETGLPEKWTPDGENQLWTYPLSGRGAPVITNDRLYVLGYRGDGPDLQELIVCLDANSGKLLWEQGFNDFLSDIVYNRYSIGSPVVDEESGNIFFLTAAGIFCSFTPDGKLLWHHSLMEEYGRLTFPNGRTGSPIIDGDLVIIHSITSNWGADGPARDRFYAFDKKSGQLVWSSTPGGPPQDSSFSTPVLAWQNGKRVLYAGTGCGNVVCLNARTGDPLWRFQLSRIGINASVVLHGDKIMAIHDGENLDSSETGRMVAVRIGTEPKDPHAGPVVLGATQEIWRTDLSAISSSPVVNGNRLYQMVNTGELCCVDVETGKVLWKKKLGPDQLHASPLYADGKLYIPLTNGTFHILRPSDEGAEELCQVQLGGSCLGAPAIWRGRIYVLTTEKLYCFGSKSPGPAPATVKEEAGPKPGPATRLQAVPSEVVLTPGQKMPVQLNALDANGLFVSTITNAKWASFIPPTAKVKAVMNAHFDPAGELVAEATAKQSAGAFQAVADGLKGVIRGRVLPHLPIRENFEHFDISVPHEIEPDVKFAYPPLPWIGARFKWEVRDLDGNKVLAKTLDNNLFQRAITFIGQPEEKNYTVEADVMTDGNRRNMSIVGVINQHYIITLVGNWQQIEVSSNHDRIKVGVPFKIKPKTWYRLKTRVDVAPDGTGVVRGKAWERDQQEPEAWTIEVPHTRAHTSGAPGLYGFSLQSLFRVYIDNVEVTPNG